jgi:hypothetical protein
MYLPHTNICVLFARILIFHLLSLFLNYVTFRSHMGPPNMIYRVLQRLDFERTEL